MPDGPALLFVLIAFALAAAFLGYQAGKGSSPDNSPERVRWGKNGYIAHRPGSSMKWYVASIHADTADSFYHFEDAREMFNRLEGISEKGEKD